MSKNMLSSSQVFRGKRRKLKDMLERVWKNVVEEEAGRNAKRHDFGSGDSVVLRREWTDQYEA